MTATPHLAVYDPTVQFEFWFSKRGLPISGRLKPQPATLARAVLDSQYQYQNRAMIITYIRSVNTVGKFIS
ncbi:phage tail tip protein J-related protein [Escherichia coli]|uniref:phage tail tip protein J-related protein n=1 Tax=Escherichia coli TaxID=562 RepID=UPI003CC911B9